MKLKIAFIAALTLAAGWLQADSLPDESLGLSKTSVFEDPTPPEFAYSDLPPKKSGVLPRFWEDAPPQIPHKVDKLIPITAKLNKCLECHDEPDDIGDKVKGEPTPMPESHYVKDGKDLAMSGRRHFCTLCHVPQAGVGVLVDNTFGAGK